MFDIGRKERFDTVSFASLNDRTIDRMLRTKWIGNGNYSDRIWKNQNEMVDKLSEIVIRGAMTGMSLERMQMEFRQTFQVEKYKAERLLRTEMAYFHNEAEQESYRDLGIEQYIYIATLDNRTSEVCADLDGKVFKTKDGKVGVNLPPMHPNCRSTTGPYYDESVLKNMKRRARNQEGVGKEIEYRNYREWEAELKARGLKPGEEIDIYRQKKNEDEPIDLNTVFKNVLSQTTHSASDNTIIKLDISNYPDAFTSKKSEKENTEKFINYINSLPDADPNVMKLYNSLGKLDNFSTNGIVFKVSHAKRHGLSISHGARTGKISEVKLTIPKLEGDNLIGQINTTLHEKMHLIDYLLRDDPTVYGDCFAASNQNLIDVVNKTDGTIGKDIMDLFQKHNAEFKNVRANLNQKYNDAVDDLKNKYMDKGKFKSLNDQLNFITESKKARKDIMEIELDYEARNIMGGGINALQDIYDALSGGLHRQNGTVIFGHGTSYYSTITNKIDEIIVNYASLSITRQDLIDLLKKDKPDLVKVLEDVIMEMIKKVNNI